jgi:hypothetical protein
VDVAIGGNRTYYDSTLPEDRQPKTPMRDFFVAQQKQKLIFIVRPELTVKDIKGREKFIEKLGVTNPAILALLNTIMSRDALVKMAEPTWWAVPSKPV